VLDLLEGKVPRHIVNHEVTADTAWRHKLDSFGGRSAALAK
jgi:hypothetical protein